MLDFIADRMDTTSREALENHHSLIVMKDHTCIQTTDHIYAFLWLDYEQFQGRTVKTRPDKNPLGNTPRIPEAQAKAPHRRITPSANARNS